MRINVAIASAMSRFLLHAGLRAPCARDRMGT
ncbi:hypothetical protein Desaf_2581 [Desulfocurvibacter africanus subsp. africanus str. Walvis Bay]|uniref:Uncharacterized protein n=1 Tax=Desulfocurvibacter africanus subsp. africanus str. Walvis Bay TaxID=690850 RepID=F3YZU5_DESAF|nr:hypothetical protein Desaf_2581 [Desulfocurvibacter africanus subsp. africanus str. Walvis Bay]